jgi:hypothetical protein
MSLRHSGDDELPWTGESTLRCEASDSSSAKTYCTFVVALPEG